MLLVTIKIDFLIIVIVVGMKLSPLTCNFISVTKPRKKRKTIPKSYLFNNGFKMSEGRCWQFKYGKTICKLLHFKQKCLSFHINVLCYHPGILRWGFYNIWASWPTSVIWVKAGVEVFLQSDNLVLTCSTCQSKIQYFSFP